MATELQRALQLHRNSHPLINKTHQHSKSYGNGADSLIYAPKVAATIDKATLHYKALQGLSELSTTHNLTDAGEELFSTQWLHHSRTKREFLKPQEAKRLDDLVQDFLLRIVDVWNTEAGMDCLEYLVRQFDIHRFNVDDLISITLPQHDSPNFVRVVRICHIPRNSNLIFLEAVKSSGTVLSRKSIVKKMIKNPHLIALICGTLNKFVKRNISIPAKMSKFFTLVFVELLTLTVPRDASIKQILAAVELGLRRPMNRELHMGSLAVLTQAAVRFPITADVCQYLLRTAFASILIDPSTNTLRNTTGSTTHLPLLLLFTSLFLKHQVKPWNPCTGGIASTGTLQRYCLDTGRRLLSGGVLPSVVVGWLGNYTGTHDALLEVLSAGTANCTHLLIALVRGVLVLTDRQQAAAATANEEVLKSNKSYCMLLSIINRGVQQTPYYRSTTNCSATITSTTTGSGSVIDQYLLPIVLTLLDSYRELYANATAATNA
eukprot:Lankesteria_metandrocarpae@DN6368_c0_g1_i1.p1